jgi:hypothetical protein
MIAVRLDSSLTDFPTGVKLIITQVLATTEDHLRAAWRICLGLGVIPPLSLLYLRIKLQEPEAFVHQSITRAKTPYWLVIKVRDI